MIALPISSILTQMALLTHGDDAKAKKTIDEAG
jgi:hypothetical protein